MFCPKCGASLPDNAKFCDKCGAPVTSNNQQTVNQNMQENTIGAAADTSKSSTVVTEKKKNKVPIIIGCIVAVIVLIMVFSGGGIDPVETVKNGCLTQFSSTVTIEDALNNRFENGEWSYDESTIEEDAYNVYFDGYDPLTEMDWRISFFLEDAGDNESWITVDAIAAGGDVEYDATNIYYLLSYIYTGNLDEYYTDLGTALWDAMLSTY